MNFNRDILLDKIYPWIISTSLSKSTSTCINIYQCPNCTNPSVDIVQLLFESIAYHATVAHTWKWGSDEKLEIIMALEDCFSSLSLSILHTQTYVDIISVIWFKIVLNESYGINIIKILISTVNASPWLNDHNLSTLKTCCIKLKWDPHHHNIKVRGKRSMANPNQLQQKRQKKHAKILNPNQLQQKMQFFPPRLGRINSVMYRSSTIAL